MILIIKDLKQDREHDSDTTNVESNERMGPYSGPKQVKQEPNMVDSFWSISAIMAKTLSLDID